MNKILVTGGGGYIGSVATYLMLQRGFSVVVVDNFSTGNREPLKLFKRDFRKTFNYHNVDLKDKDKLISVFKKEKDIQAVVHYAAHCMVSESMEKPEKYFENNVCGSNNLLTVMDECDVKNIVFSSTCEVYGDAEYVPVDEGHPVHPNTPYGESKIMTEKMIKWYGKLKNLNYIILRYFNVCGASDDGKIGDAKKPSVLLVQNAVKGALGIEPFYLTYRKVDTKDGSPIRDYINVVDLNEAHIMALEYLMQGGKSEIINLGTGEGSSVLEMVSKVQKITGKKFQAKRGKSRKGEADRIYADISKAKRVLKWRPKRTIEDSVKSLVKWYNAHPNGWMNSED